MFFYLELVPLSGVVVVLTYLFAGAMIAIPSKTQKHFTPNSTTVACWDENAKETKLLVPDKIINPPQRYSKGFNGPCRAMSVVKTPTFITIPTAFVVMVTIWRGESLDINSPMVNAFATSNTVTANQINRR